MRFPSSSGGRRRRQALIASVAVCVQLAVAAGPASAFPDGQLDTTFNGTGKVTLDLGGGDGAYDVVVQPDGKIVAAGVRTSGPSSRISLARYNPNGSLDCLFGACGVTALMVNGAWGTAVALDGAGNIVVAGTRKASGTTDFIVARFRANGSIDPSFNSPNGYVTTNLGPQDEAADLAIQPDGKILVVGTGGAGVTTDVALVRYLSDGTLDQTFGTGGKMLSNPVGSDESASAVTLQPNGFIVVAGRTSSGSSSDGLLMRYSPTGQPDALFGGGTGFVTTSFGPGPDAFNDVVVHTSGRIIVGGSSASPGGDFALARYTSAGVLDTTFGVGGTVTTDVGTLADAVQSVSLVYPYFIVVTGWTNGGSGDFAVARYAMSGQLDTTFGQPASPGRVSTDFGGSDAAFGGALDAIGCTIVAAGRSNGDFALARYRLCHSMPM